MTPGMALAGFCDIKAQQEQLEYLQLQYLQKQQQLMQYQSYLTSQMAQSAQQLKRSQSTQQSSSRSYAPVHPSNGTLLRQRSTNTISDLYVQTAAASPTESCSKLPGLPKPPSITLHRRDSTKSDACSSEESTTSSRYKTELCRPFEETGNCRYGSKCQFAHGAHELRSLSRHPRYKTEFCRTFHTTGFCSYGQRCNFIHNEDERRAPAAASGITRPKALDLCGCGVKLTSSTGSLGSASSLMSYASVSPAGSVYGGDASPTRATSYISDTDSFLSRLSPTPSLSSDVSFPSPTGRCQLTDDPFDSRPVDYSLSLSLISSLNL